MNVEADIADVENSPAFEGLSRTLRVAEVIRRGNLDYVSKPGELVESEFETGSLGTLARKAFALMLRKAGPDSGDAKVFRITKKELRGSHKGNERIQAMLDELLRVIVRIRTTTSTGRPAIMSQSLLANCVEEISDDGSALIEYEFSEGFRQVLKKSDYYARVNLGVMLALQSRYSLSIYDLGCLIINRNNKTTTMPLQELRNRLGVPENSFKNFAEFRRDILAKSKAEIDQLADFTFDWDEVRGSGRGRPVEAVRVIFTPKNPVAQNASASELDQPKIGRKARRSGSVDAISTALPSEPSKPQFTAPARPFPDTSLHFCGDHQIISIVADFGQGWDRDEIAKAFRQKMGAKLTTLTGEALYKSWEGFCKAYARTRGRP